jgi:uncharacterized membrane protein YfcA
MDSLAIFAVIGFAIFTQSVTGFGQGLIATSVLAGMLGAQVAVPLVALVSLTSELVILARYRHAFRFGAVARLSVASIIAIPLGSAALNVLDESIVLRALGTLVVGYSVYALLKLRLPRVERPAWAYGFGFVAGFLSGLYNVSGPPVVIYGTCRSWSPAEFRSNLQGFFILNGVTAIAAHVLNQRYTSVVLQDYLITLPAIVAGLALGFVVDRYIDAILFRKIVYALLIVLGLRLVIVG